MRALLANLVAVDDSDVDSTGGFQRDTDQDMGSVVAWG